MKGFEDLSNYLLGGLTLLGVLTVLVIVHEYGHFLAAKLFRMKVDAFAIMMGGRRQTDLTTLLSRPILPSWAVAVATLLAVLVALVGAFLSQHTIVTVALGFLAIGIPIWIASRIGALYQMPGLSSLRFIGGGWLAAMALLYFSTQFKNVSVDVILSMLLYGSMLGLMILYYQPVMRKSEDSGFGDGELEVGQETVPVKFRPVAAMRTKQGTEFSLLMLPLGGFAAIRGMHPKPDGSETGIEGGFYSKPPWQRLVVLFAGPLFSVAFGVFLLASIYLFSGIERPNQSAVVGAVSKGGPADKAGLKTNDRILSVNGENVDKFFDVIKIVRVSPDRPMTLAVERGGRRLTLTATPELSTEPSPVIGENLLPTKEKRVQAKLGISPATEKVKVSVGEAFSEACLAPARMATGLVGLIRSPVQHKDDVGGIGTLAIVSTEAAKQGFERVLELAGLLSVSLGFMNLLPIPPLDGGQMVVAFIEMLRRGRRLSIRVQNAVSTAGFAFLIVLMFVVMAVDVGRFVGK